MKIVNKISGDRIYLRLLSLTDASKTYCSWLNSTDVNQYLETRQATINDLRNYIKEKNEKEDCLFLGVFDISNDKHIGNLKLEPIDFDAKKATFSIVIGEKEYWGKGIGTEATKLIVDYAFNDLGLLSVNLGVVSENKRAIWVYKKAGFKIKEVIPKSLDHNGVKHDKVVMVINEGDLK